MKKFKIFLSPPHMGNNEQSYVNEAFESNWIAPLGTNVEAFESQILNYIGDDSHVAITSSGTAALHLALNLLGIGLGDEVICQSFTFSASANPILYMGATPIFVDSEEETWNISPELLKDAIEDRIKYGKKPKAIIAVHLYGMPYKVEEVHAVANHYDIPIIEDSAEALGSNYHGKKCGGFGDIGVVSFNGNKIITTSGGGALISKNKAYRDKAIFLATQARDNAPHYQHSHVGYNYRMSNVLAGIGRGQMEVLAERVQSRRDNFSFYKKHLSHLENIEFLEEPNGFYSNRWLSCILTDSFETRESIRLELLENQIESRPLWKPLHEQPVFEKYPNKLNGVSSDLFRRGLCLPSGSSLSYNELNQILDIILKVLQNDKKLLSQQRP